jgi:hypothetical protein
MISISIFLKGAIIEMVPPILLEGEINPCNHLNLKTYFASEIQSIPHFLFSLGLFIPYSDSFFSSPLQLTEHFLGGE